MKLKYLLIAGLFAFGSCITLDIGSVPYMDATGYGSRQDIETKPDQADYCYSYETSPLAKLLQNARSQEGQEIVGVKDFTIYIETRGMQDCWVLNGAAVDKNGKTREKK